MFEGKVHINVYRQHWGDLRKQCCEKYKDPGFCTLYLGDKKDHCTLSKPENYS